MRSLVVIHLNCDPSDDFTRIWQKVFRRIPEGIGTVANRYPDVIYPDDVVSELSNFSLNTLPIVILDEFDKVGDTNARLLTANTIKNSSDHAPRVTVIVVGVANSVTDLIAEHESVSRCLKQVRMPRMFQEELRQIIQDRLRGLGMKIQENALAHIVASARGLPHYVHLFGQRSALVAMQQDSSLT